MVLEFIGKLDQSLGDQAVFCFSGQTAAPLCLVP
jgi:hypothetical protein